RGASWTPCALAPPFWSILLPCASVQTDSRSSPSAPGSRSRELHDCIGRTLVATGGTHGLLYLLHALAIHRVMGDTLNCLAQCGGIDGFFLQHDAQSQVHDALRMELLFGLLRN